MRVRRMEMHLGDRCANSSVGRRTGNGGIGDRVRPCSRRGARASAIHTSPLDGNGGYDVTHYDLAFTFDPATGAIDSVATITAVATQNLSSVDLVP